MLKAIGLQQRRSLFRCKSELTVLTTVRRNAADMAAAGRTPVNELATGDCKLKGKRWDKVDKWVMFSDLHVSVKTLDVCIRVLQKIKREAAARKAGILFLGRPCTLFRPQWNGRCVSQFRRFTAGPLSKASISRGQRKYARPACVGDFWHARGALPVEPLNAILHEFESWRQPTLMLVGNHDQVSVGGLDHALQPLAAACSAIHILDVPTLYRYAYHHHICWSPA